MRSPNNSLAQTDAPPPLRTEGQRLLCEVAQTHRQLSRRLGVSFQTIMNWRAGDSIPTRKARALIAAELHIPVKAWTIRPRLTTASAFEPSGPAVPVGSSTRANAVVLTDGPKPNPKPDDDELDDDDDDDDDDEVDDTTPPPSLLDEVFAMLASIRRELKRKDITPAERLRLAQTQARYLKLRLHFEQAHELTEDRYVREHPSWIATKNEIARVLAQFPDAARAVAEALERLKT